MVIVIVAGFLSATGAFWVSNSSLRSDVRDIKTTLDGVINSQNLQINDMRREIDTGRQKQALTDVRLEEMRNTIAEIRGFLTGAGILKGPGK